MYSAVSQRTRAWTNFLKSGVLRSAIDRYFILLPDFLYVVFIPTYSTYPVGWMVVSFLPSSLASYNEASSTCTLLYRESLCGSS